MYDVNGAMVAEESDVLSPRKRRLTAAISHIPPAALTGMCDIIGAGDNADESMEDDEDPMLMFNWKIINPSWQPTLFEKNRRNEREEIRRKLAMGDEDYYGGERTLKKPNLSTRLQSGMNLQICFMNEAHEQSEAEAKSPNTAEPTQIQPVPAVPENTPPPKPPRLSPDVLADSLQIERKEGEEEEDFLARQAKLQADARMALAQAPAMAHMQLQVEKQAKKKSPIAEMVGIPGFGDGRRKKLERHLLLDMNIAQLQVVVNDLHTQIENLNEQLMRLLVERDDLHMEQDSKLVDIEDLTRRYQELNEKYNTQLQQQQQQ
ncbi:unnamed protein product, partial [Owenia fusiformis]